MFSNCGQFEFSCSDGTCIPIEKKCDFIPNCWDKGDETNCQLLNDENMQDYDSNIPDIVLDKRGNILKKIVKVSTTIKEIQNIAEVQSRFTTTFNLKLEWIDARLTWYEVPNDSESKIRVRKNGNISLSSREN